MSEGAYADQIKGYDWDSEKDAFMDGYNQGKPGVNELVLPDDKHTWGKHLRRRLHLANPAA